MGIQQETELCAPIKQFLEAHGYQVRAEVKDCDLVAMREDDLVVVELKRTFNLALLIQGIERQKLTHTVYLAVEAPRSRRSAPRWSDIQQLCRRLGLGLMTVSFARKTPKVDVICDPEPLVPRRSHRKRSQLLKEFQKRSGDYNVGGSTKRPIVTAYREDVLRIAYQLKLHGPSRVRDLRKATGVLKVGSILLKNFYGWFEPIDRGIYQLTPRGEEALVVYADVIDDGT